MPDPEGWALQDELDRQRDVLLARGYPALSGRSVTAFTAMVEPLRPLLADLAGMLDPLGSEGPTRVPFVLVVSEALVRAEDAVSLTTLAGRDEPGFVDRHHGGTDLATYRPLPGLGMPSAPVYLLVDVERGDDLRGLAPQDALPLVLARGRTPLTIHEGIALITQVPAVLEKNHCFMLSGSRRADRRVPALWISRHAPKLGWCWDGNPHDWLGTASARTRLAAPSGSR